MTKSESYSALSIRSYSNYIENGTVSFTYGVDRFGPRGAMYDVSVFVNDDVIYRNSFSMEPGSGNGSISFPLNTTAFPVKVKLVLSEQDGTSYDVYFWLKGSR